MSVTKNMILETQNEGPEFKAMLKYLSERQRARKDSDISKLARAVSKRDLNTNPRSVFKVLKKYEALGLGRIVYGRNGKPNRFHWSVSLTSLGKLLKGGNEILSAKFRDKALPEIVDMGDAIKNIRETDVAVPMTQVTIRLGKLEISTPLDEAEYIIKVLKTMPQNS